MIDLMQIILLKWNKSNKKYYSEKGYTYTNNGDLFYVYAKDLPEGSHEYVKAYCDVCGKEQNIPIRNYNRNTKRNDRYVCQPCSVAVRHSKTLDNRRTDYMNRIKEKCKENGYELLSKDNEICNNISYIKYLCPIHGEQTMRISNFLNGRKCSRCNNDNHSADYRLQYNDIISRVEECDGELLNPNEYINQSTRNLKFKCQNCGKIFVSTLQRFLQHGGQLCRDCSKTESVGEVRIRKYLENKGIDFKQEYWFNDCRDINPLPFDFYLPSKNTIIEFDGRQHFEETDHFSYPLEKVRSHDKIKNQYCKQNGIRLIRIPYTRINHINEILDNQIFT